MEFSWVLIIAAPMETVFRLIEDPERRKLWVPRLVDTVPAGGPGVQRSPGARFACIFLAGSRLFEYQGEVTASANPELFSVIVGGRHFHLALSYELEDAEGGTRLKHTARFMPRSVVARVGGPLLGRLAGKQLSRQLRLLKAQAEGEASIRR